MYLTVNQPVQVADTFNFMQKQLEAFTSEENFPDSPITMASATLTLGDRTELFEFLHIHASRCRIISGSLDRPNLFYSVEPVHTFNLRQKLDAVYDWLRKHFDLEPQSWRTKPRRSGIIYCATSVHCIDVAKDLQERFGPGYAKAIYNERHGMSKDQQKAVVQQWLDGEIHVLVATVSLS